MKRRKHPFQAVRITTTFEIGKDVFSGPNRVEIGEHNKIDEILLGDWLHIERLDLRVAYVRIGDREYIVSIPLDASKEIGINEIL